jgi:hypothetical protein
MSVTESKKDQSPNLGAGLFFMISTLAQFGPKQLVYFSESESEAILVL